MYFIFHFYFRFGTTKKNILDVLDQKISAFLILVFGRSHNSVDDKKPQILMSLIVYTYFVLRIR